MGRAPARTRARDAEIPRAARNALSGFALGAAGANVVMQLSRLPVGHGVARSTVESGRIDRHPLKRARTTLTYLAVAYLGTEDERAHLREEVNRSHRPVRSRPGDPVRYNAFDRDLQLWVAACLYKGTEDVYRMLYPGASAADLDALYRHGARLGTTLQMAAGQWPADREAFAAYWDASLDRVSTDALTRDYLTSFARLGFLPGPVAAPLGRTHQFFVTGFLPQRFRDEFGFGWGPRRQAAFTAFGRSAAVVHRLLPPVLAGFPFTYHLWDFRRRMRTGRPIV
ncbi:oxygenase MpaB family protein [Actinomadura flavalba]|uniref:oxygenase MpaB family protein n=1 Tax=Actinomadura flavalba TaxID=1120938 RepID=UPI0003784D93|nr:oxygenase MpaB family protein [Actinomadura flavalba]